MKAKPNLDIDSFRSADPEIAVASETKQKAASKPAPKEGRRVTESDIIDEALERHFARRK